MSTLTPHEACLPWQPGLLWLNVVSEAVLACGSLAMAIAVAVFLLRRHGDMLRIFVSLIGALGGLAAVGAVSCALSIAGLWVPVDGLAAAIKVVLALISAVLGTGLLLGLPHLLVMPTRVQLLQAYAALEEETRQRRNAEAMVRRFQEMEATEAQVRQAQKMEAIGQLTGGVAHDFNNILTVITGSIEMLSDGVKDRPLLAQITSMIGAAAARGADLTRHLLAFARQQPLQPRSTDINALVVDVAGLLRPTLGVQIEIESMLAHDAAPALIDPSQLSTAILNLALNARDAMPNGGKLILETKNVVLDTDYASRNSEVRPGNYVMIAVSDTGEGIPRPLLDKVFDPFFTTKGLGKGSGLGLSMVYGFVRQSNGHIKIYSEEGHGTTVRLYLPQASPAQDAEADAPEVEPASSGSERGDETILIVEDDVLVRDYVVAQIERLGYRTIAAGNAGEALAVIDEAGHIDLLFTDVIMPGGMNGRQLATEAVKRRPDLKVLYTSGYTENAIVHHGRLDAGVLLLPKPYLSSDLARAIRTALAT
ncbi:MULTISPECIES: ATP-binding protein [unclassified Bradyrhizobium]|uniref:ATP-binding protein n=1 Tax=unclassified Bradyrhizobium TaxID=2631580 RepID=UPI002916C6C7|nr:MULTISPECIES: ATP-binding protein [unclassified Bradyrhizobium]